MKKLCLFAMLLILVGGTILAGGALDNSTPNVPKSNKQAPVQPSGDVQPVGPQPKIVLPEKSFDFGYAPEGFFMVHPYAIRNEGEAELVIERVRTTCGCTSAPLEKTNIEPGDETYVTVIFNSRRYRHRTSKGTIISSNDPVNRSVRATFTANMDTTGLPFEIEPFGLSIEKGKKPPKKMVFKIKNGSDQNYELSVVDYTSDVLKEPKIKDKKLKAGGKTEIAVEMNKDYDYAANYIKASFTVEASGKKPIRFTIPIKGSGPQ
ncbi:DUF1573 domain-containing protein [bacterium]|nr:DUF1573 domain-containing protein [bacterium]